MGVDLPFVSGSHAVAAVHEVAASGYHHNWEGCHISQSRCRHHFLWFGDKIVRGALEKRVQGCCFGM